MLLVLSRACAFSEYVLPIGGTKQFGVAILSENGLEYDGRILVIIAEFWPTASAVHAFEDACAT